MLGATLFSIGAVGLLVRRNPLVMFMCIELMLNAVNLSFVALAVRFGDISGQTAVFFVMVVAAAEVVVGLGIIISILRRRPNRRMSRNPASGNAGINHRTSSTVSPSAPPGRRLWHRAGGGGSPR